MGPLLGGEDQVKVRRRWYGGWVEQPGDRQPQYRDEVVTKGREAAKVMHDFDQQIRAIRQTVNATPADMNRFSARIMELAEQEEREQRGTLAAVGRAVYRDPTFRWLSTGANVFYPPAAVCLIASVLAMATGPRDGVHLYGYGSLFVLGLAFLLFAGFSEPRR